MKKTVIAGATTNPSRYAHIAANMLTDKEYEIVPVGIKKGNVRGKEILDIRKNPEIDNVDTLTLYLGPQNQKEYYQYFMDLKPKRIIFNPGTENPELEKIAHDQGIEIVHGCTLVMLSVGNY